jgi:hypothetical protein
VEETRFHCRYHILRSIVVRVAKKKIFYLQVSRHIKDSTLQRSSRWDQVLYPSLEI